MKDIFKVLDRLVKERGILQVADLLGHSNSLRLKRWIAAGSIPESQREGVKAILELRGELE